MNWNQSIEGIYRLNEAYSDRIPQSFIDAIDAKLPAIFSQLFGKNVLDESINGSLLLDFDSLSVDGATYQILSYLRIEVVKTYILEIKWDKNEIFVSNLYSPNENQNIEIFCGDVSRQLAAQGVFTQTALIELGNVLSKQFETVTKLALEENPFQFIPEGEKPSFTDENIQIVRGDLVGPDNHGYGALIVWQAKEKASRPYGLNDLEQLANGLKFSWNPSIQDDYFANNYLNHPGSPIWVIDGIQTDLSWYKWYGLPDLILQFWTKYPLNEAELKRAEEIFWQDLLENMKTTPKSYKALCFHEEIAEQGYAEYFSGFEQVKPGHYRMHANLQVCENDVIECWIRALDSLADQFGVNKIRVGSN